MKSTVEKLTSNQVRIDFTVDAQAFEKGIQAAYNKMKGRVNIPGFRRGHAPRKVIELHYGKSVFYDDALEAIFPDAYSEAIREHNIDPVDRPQVDVTKVDEAEGLEFSATVFVRPDVELGIYKGVEATKQVVDVTDDDIQAELERARERVARYIEVTDRPVKLDDQVDINYAGFVGEDQFEGGTADHHKLVIGSGNFIPGFEEQLIGAAVGSDVDVNVTFPEEYHEPSLAGKEAVFHVTVNGIEEKEVPELDDEFVKDVSDCDTLEEYKAQIRERLTKAAEEKAETAFENEVVEAVVENAKVDIPEAMIDDELRTLLRDMEMRMMRQGLNIKDFLKYTGQTEDQMKDMYRPEAESRVRVRLVLDAVRKAEDIQATDDEIDAEIAKYAERMNQTVEDFTKTLMDGDRSFFADSVSMRKTVDMLKNEAVPE